MEIRDGCIDDILSCIDLIHESIPHKKKLSIEEIESRLAGKTFGVKIAEEKGINLGLYVWYEENSSLYLWLGATLLPGRGIGSALMESIIASTSYERWYVKTGKDNAAARQLLERYGFVQFMIEGDVLYLEKYF